MWSIQGFIDIILPQFEQLYSKQLLYMVAILYFAFEVWGDLQLGSNILLMMSMM